MINFESYRPYQVIGREFLRARSGACLADDTGMGKTIMTLGAVNELPGPIMIICHDINKRDWTDWIKILDPGAPIHWAVFAGNFNQELVQGWMRTRTRGYFLIHHEGLRFRAHILAAIGTWECIVADEAHMFKNHSSKMRESLISFKTRKKIALTATPMEKSPSDYWTMLNWFAPTIFTTYWGFRRDWCIKIETVVPWGNAGRLKPERAEAFAHLLQPYYLRRTPEDVGSEMPEKTYKEINLDLDPEQEHLIRLLEKETFIEMEKDQPLEEQMFIRNALARFAKLRKATLDPWLIGYEAGSTKRMWLKSFDEDMTDPFLIFGHNRDFIESIPLFMNRIGVIHGKVKMEDRYAVRDSFMEGKLDRVAGTIDTMGESINLQRARVAVFVERHRSTIKMHQAEGRINRLGARGSSVYMMLHHPDTVDDIVLESLNNKWDDINLIHRFMKYLQDHK